MKIKKIRLKNGYKRFKDLTIDLGDNPPRIVALVGPNGCGKSSVFDGMLFLHTNWEPIGQFGRKGANFHSMDGKPVFDWSNIEIEFDSGSYQTILDSRRQLGSAGTMFNYRNPYRYNSNLNVTSLQTITDIAKNLIGASSSVDLDDKMIDNYQRLYSFIQNYYKKVNTTLTYPQVKDDIIGRLNKILERCLSLEIVDEGDIVAGRGMLYFKKIDQQTEFGFNVLSSGEKEIVDILLDIFLKQESYTDTIYIIDEPELHLNASIQRSLLIEIEQLIPKNCQIWIATHSVGFLNALKQELNEKSAVIHFEGDYASVPMTLMPMIKSRNNWQKVFKTALEEMVELISPKTIVYCEGEKEIDRNGKEKGLDAKVYNKIFEIAHPDVLFVSSGGGNQPAEYSAVALDILKKAFMGTEILILKDRGGKDSYKSDEKRKELLDIDSKKRILFRREIENYLFDPKILQLYKGDVNIVNIFGEGLDYKTEYLKPYYQKIKQELGFNGDIKNLMVSLAELITPETEVFKELEKVIFC